MYKTPDKTLFIGKKLIYVPECPSTNDLASQYISSEKEVPEGTLFITGNQTLGRGQKGNSWLSEPGQNLTFSVVLKPLFLNPIQQFRLVQATSLGVRDLVQHYTKDTVWIKWPNDIYVNDKKICGMLIENQVRGQQISSSVVGIGLNVNQKAFDLPRATSLRQETSLLFDLNEVLWKLMESLESWYVRLRSTSNYDRMEEAYYGSLYWRGMVHRFQARGVDFEGVITGVDGYGRLQVLRDGITEIFDVRDITYLE